MSDSFEEKLGYLQAKVESLAEKMSQHMDDEAKFKVTMLETLNKLSSEMSLAKNFILFLRLLGYTILLILAMKFGDVKSLWHEFLSGG